MNWFAINHVVFIGYESRWTGCLRISQGGLIHVSSLVAIQLSMPFSLYRFYRATRTSHTSHALHASLSCLVQRVKRKSDGTTYMWKEVYCTCPHSGSDTNPNSRGG